MELNDSRTKKLERMKNYNKSHSDTINLRAREYFKKLKADPEKYKLYLKRKRDQYKIQNERPALPVKYFE
jgi:hypothetical protein